MPYRVVMPRSLPFDDANRVQAAVWKSGYGTRVAGRDAAHPDRQIVEFLRVLEELPDPARVGAYESDLDRTLGSTRVHATAQGSGAWLETVQRPPRARAPRH